MMPTVMCPAVDVAQILAFIECKYFMGFPGDSGSKEFARHAGDSGSISGLGWCPGEGNGNPLQYSCLENPLDRGAWQATVHGGHKEPDTA